MLLTSPLSSPLKNPVRDPLRPAPSGGAAALSSPQSQILYVAEGDSITSGLGTTLGGYALRYFNANPYRVVYIGTAYPGRSLAGIVTNAATVDGYYTDSSPSGYGWSQGKVLSVLTGANNFATPVATFLADYAAYCDARRAVGWKVVVGTVLPRAPVAGGSAATETWRSTANAAIRTWVGVHCDAIMDFAADAYMGSYAEAALTTYYQDGVHPTDAGESRLLDIAKFAIRSVTTPQTDPQFSSWGTTTKSVDLALSNANYTIGSNAAPGSFRNGRMAVGRDTGKWYTEFLIGGTNGVEFGLSNGRTPYAGAVVGAASDGIGNNFSYVGISPSNNQTHFYFYGALQPVNSPVVTPYVVGDRCGLFVDFDAGKIWFARNNTFVASGNPATGANPSFTFPANRMMFVVGATNDATATLTLPANAGALAYPLLSGWSAF